MKPRELKIDFKKSNKELRNLGYRTLLGRNFLDFLIYYKDEMKLGLRRMEEYVINLDTNEQIKHKKHKVASDHRINDGLSPQHPDHPSTLLDNLILILAHIYDEDVSASVRIISHPDSPAHLILDTVYQVGEDTDTEQIRYRQVVRFTLQCIQSSEVLYNAYLDLKPKYSEKAGFLWQDVSEIIAHLPTYSQSDFMSHARDGWNVAPISMVESLIKHPLTHISGVRVMTFEMSKMRPQTITHSEAVQIEEHRYFKNVDTQQKHTNFQVITALGAYINEMRLDGESVVTFSEQNNKISQFTIWYVREIDGQTVVEAIKLSITYANMHDGWQKVAEKHKWFKNDTRKADTLTTEVYPYASGYDFERLLRAI